jgi:hypothetical protein
VEIYNRQKKAIDKIVDGLFHRATARLLGKYFKGPKIFFNIVDNTNPLNTLAGIYHYTQVMSGGPAVKEKKKTIKTLSEITGNYLNAERLKTTNRINVAIAGADTKEDAVEAVEKEITRATKYINKIIPNEIRHTQAQAEKSGIQEVSASLGIDDPVVFKVGVIDKKLCKTCTSLWHTNNLQVPKLYKMSELSQGYMQDHKNPNATLGPSHPNCRHVLTFLPPNFGFKDNGSMEFKGFGYDEYEAQRDK